MDCSGAVAFDGGADSMDVPDESEMTEHSSQAGDKLIAEATRDGLVGRYGSEWVARLPALMTRLSKEGQWTPIRRLEGGRTACVLLVHIDGAEAVVKVTPDIPRSAREIAALEVLSRKGIAPHVLRHWIDNNDDSLPSSVALLELVGDGRSLRDMSYPNVPTEDLAALLGVVAQCGREKLPVSLQSLETHLAWRFDKPRGGGLHGAPPVSDSELAEARGVLRDLVATSDPTTWVHGTLHPGNMVVYENRVSTIDPRPFLGDSVYDVAELALKLGSEHEGHPHNLADGLNLMRAIRRHLSFDENRVLAWMQVFVATGV